MSRSNKTERLKKAPYKINSLFFARFFTILKLSSSFLSLVLSLIILFVSIGQQILVYYVGLLASKFTKTLVDQDFSAFQGVLWQALGLMSAVSLVNAIVQYASSILYIHWRETMCQHLHKHYFKGFNFLHVNSSLSSHNFIDNVDQRITADLDKMLSTFSSIFPLLLLSPFTIAYYAYKCYLTTGIYGPLVIFAVFCGGTIINKFLMGPVVSRTVAQELAEGNFRYFHMRVRSCCQSIAFYRGQTYESETANQRLDELLTVQARLFFSQFVVKSFTSFYDYMGAIQSYLVIAIPIFRGDFDHKSPGDRSELVGAYAFQSLYLIYSFSQLIDLSNKISEIAGVTHRVGELLESLYILTSSSELQIRNSTGRKQHGVDDSYEATEDLLSSYDSNDSNEGQSDIKNNNEKCQSVEPVLKVQGLTFGLPDGAKLSSMIETNENDDVFLIKYLDLTVRSGDRLLISGPNGVGKSSLFRVLNQMWHQHAGRITYASNKTFLFLPQTPYFCQGSLMDQLFYPTRVEFSEDNLRKANEVLKTLNLEYIVERCGSLSEFQSWDWSSVFSQGEAQRLSFARVFLNPPSVLFMDEATSAVSSDEQTRIFRLLSLQSRIECLVSIAHSNSLLEFHNCCLRINADKTWQFERVSA